MAFIINGEKIGDEVIEDEFESIKEHYINAGEVVCCDRDEEFQTYARENVINRVLLEQASIELAASGDPRTAVLRSYAVLETVLASHELERAKSETVTEHLRRALRNLRVDATPLIELGRLYELARFSDHPISKTQQIDAAEALERARLSLAGAS